MFWIYVGLGAGALLAAVAWGIRVVLWSFEQVAAAERLATDETV